MSRTRSLKTALLLGVASLVFSPTLFARDVPYDRYAPVGLEGEGAPESPGGGGELGRSLARLPVLPFEAVRWPIDQSLVFIEKYHVEDKVDWVYEQMKDHGVTPKITSLSGGGDLGGGFKLDFVRIAGLRDDHPDLTTEGLARWTTESISEYEFRSGIGKIKGSGFGLEGLVRYENRGEEDFYGIGPNTSLGDGTSYRLERTTLESTINYEFLDTWNLGTAFSFENVNITNGEDGGLGIIDEIFVRTGRQAIPGLGGDELANLKLQLKHDNRDSEELTAEGGYERLEWGYTKGLESTSGFFTYRAEAAHFFKVAGSPKRVFAVRGLVEHHDEVDHREVPFFALSRLGGFGTYPRFGRTHRGYRSDRFYDESLILLNAEYRWTAYEYRDWRMDTVLFWDFGQVFGEWSNFQGKDFRSSGGIGFRISCLEKMLLAIEIAKSSEGTEVYAKTRTPF